MNIDRDKQTKDSEYFQSEMGIRLGDPIEKGLAGCTVYRATNSMGENIVVKVGTLGRGVDEIEANLFGYQNIEDLGAGALLPSPITAVKAEVGSVLIMPDLGKDFLTTSTDNTSTKTNFDALTATLDTIYGTVVVESPELTSKSIEDTLKRLSERITKFSEVGIVGYESFADLSSVDIHGIAGANSSLFLLDFTPSNVFIVENQARFIDPWKQETYLGTPILSLAQFITYAEDAYEVPGFSDENLHYSEFVQKVGMGLGLNEEQVQLQYKLGQALQYSLSAYYRIKTQPEKAHEFLRRMASNIEDLRQYQKNEAGEQKEKITVDIHIVDNRSPEFWSETYPQLVNLYKETFAVAPWNLELTQEYVEGRLKDHFSKETSRVIVSEKDGRVIGATWFDQPTLPELAKMRGEEISQYTGDQLESLGIGDYVWLRETLVHPEMQGKGVGGKLRKNITQYMEQNFPQGVLVLTRHRQDNEVIIKLSKRDGYERTGVIQQAKIGEDIVENEFWYKVFNHDQPVQIK